MTWGGPWTQTSQDGEGKGWYHQGGQAHTERESPFHTAHNECDETAGEATEWDQEEQQRFVAWDWPVVIVNEAKERIEGNPRVAVRERMWAVVWEERGAMHGSTAAYLANMDVEAKRAMEKTLASWGKDKQKRDWMQTASGKFGFCSEWGEERQCRLCAEEGTLES